MDSKTKKILIIEDELVLLNMLKDNISKTQEDIIIEEAMDGEEGLEKALKTHPDLILLDILLPKMDGVEMAKELRKDEWGKTAKVVILSVVSDMKYVQEALGAESFEYLVKSDTSMDSVVEKVKEAIQARLNKH